MSISTLNQSYEVLYEIGKGGAGTIFLAYHRRLQKYVVLKRLKRSSNSSRWRREADALKNLRHQNLPQVYDLIVDSDSVYTVIDYIEGVTLKEYISSGTVCSQQEVSRWFQQIADALVYLHSQKPPLIHCDIKPENIIITPDGDAVLIDFNVSLMLGVDTMAGYSRAFASPEQAYLAQQIASRSKDRVSLDERTDIYSLCATFYCLMSGNPPALDGSSKPLTSMNTIYSEGLTEIIDRGIRYDREQRIQSAAELKWEIDHFSRKDNRVFLVFRVLTILFSSLLIAAGVYCLIISTVRAEEEAFQADYQKITNAIERGEPELAKAKAKELLVTYQDMLNNNPPSRGSIRMTLGNLSYQEESYTESASWYQQAMSDVRASEKAACVIRWIEALSKSGDTQKAASVLESPDANLMTDVDRYYLSAVIAAQRGEYEECKQNVEALLGKGSNTELCMRASMEVASIAPDSKTKKRWLENAERYSGNISNKELISNLAEAFANFAEDYDGSERQSAVRKSITYYEKVVSSGYYSKKDMLGYAKILIFCGRHKDAINKLEKLLKDYPNDYRILMYLAFANHALREPQKAASYAQKAYDAWTHDSSANKETINDVNIRKLIDLKEQYGV